MRPYSSGSGTVVGGTVVSSAIIAGALTGGITIHWSEVVNLMLVGAGLVMFVTLFALVVGAAIEITRQLACRQRRRRHPK